MIRLNAADCDEIFTALRVRLGQEKLEFAQLVAAAAEPHKIIALDEKADAIRFRSQSGLKSGQPLDWRNALEEDETLRKFADADTSLCEITIH